jgi:hypothetical protein
MKRRLTAHVGCGSPARAASGQEREDCAASAWANPPGADEVLDKLSFLTKEEPIGMMLPSSLPTGRAALSFVHPCRNY